MTRYVFAGHFGALDSFRPEIDRDEALVAINFGEASSQLSFGILKALKELREKFVTPSELGLDLINLAALVLAADIRLNRRIAADDGWTRRIRLHVPVSEPCRWTTAKPVLQTMLRFLTGDAWQIDFRDRPQRFRSLVLPLLPLNSLRPTDGIMLYSGGLDSLIGMIDANNRGEFPLLVSFAGEGAVSAPQQRLFDAYVQSMRNSGVNGPIDRWRFPAFRLPARLVPGVGSEDTTRGRSFMFLALGAAAGTGLHRRFDLKIPENGFIALNVPLDPTRLGSCTTRTTHPFYIHRWNELLRTLEIPGFVENSYWKKSKGEMVSECLNQEELRRRVSGSLSCAHPSAGRFKRARHAHCGVCVPCLIRRAAIESAWGAGQDTTGYRIEDLGARSLDAAQSEGQQIRGFQYALARLQARPDIASTLVRKPGPLREDLDRVEELARVYRQGMSEVSKLLEGVETHSSRMP